MKKLNILLLLLLLPVVFLFSDTGGEKSEIRKALLENSDSPEDRIRLGINIAEDVADSGNMDFRSEAESALEMLDDASIKLLNDEMLRMKAWKCKAALYSKLLMPERAREYRLRITGFSKISTETCNKALYPVAGFASDIDMPYYIDFGLRTADAESVIFLPFTGIGLIKSAFSSMVALNAGFKYFREDFDLVVKYSQGIVPDFSCFDYAFLESYATASAGFWFGGNSLKTELFAGRMLNSIESDNTVNLKSIASVSFGFREKISLQLMLADDGLNKVSAEIGGNLIQLPYSDHFSWSVEASVPLSIDLIFMEIGLLPRFFHAKRLSDKPVINIGRRHFIYENAVILGDKDQSSPYFRFYESSAAVDGVIRIFAFPLNAPADRIYLGLNFSAGLGYDSHENETDFLWAGGLSAGFDLNDNTPFELRAGADQDGRLFVYMTVVNRISHPF